VHLQPGSGQSVLLVRRVVTIATVLFAAFRVLEQWGQGQSPQALTTGPSLAAGGVRYSSSSSDSSAGSAVTSKQGIAF